LNEEKALGTRLGKYVAKLEFPDGWGGGQTKRPSAGGDNYFLE